MMKRKIGIILAIIMFVNIFGTIELNAKELTCVSEDVCSAIRQELNEIESGKIYLGMENVDFEKLCIAEAIPVYEYTSTGMYLYTNAYFLFERGEIATVLFGTGEFEFQVMPILAKDIQNLNCEKAALIYDAIGCYLYDGNTVHLLGKSGAVVAKRRYIHEIEVVELTKLMLANLKRTQPLKYVSQGGKVRTIDSYACNVNYVTQGSDEYICWAACIAMIANYLNVSNLTAVDVARRKFPTGVYNKYIEPEETVVLLGTYGIYYSYIERKPTVEEIMLNLDEGYPVYGIFRKNADFQSVHATVIYWMRATGTKILLMDPMYGSIEASLNTTIDVNTYQYTEPYTGKNTECTLAAAICEVVR